MWCVHFLLLQVYIGLDDPGVSFKSLYIQTKVDSTQASTSQLQTTRIPPRVTTRLKHPHNSKENHKLNGHPANNDRHVIQTSPILPPSLLHGRSVTRGCPPRQRLQGLHPLDISGSGSPHQRSNIRYSTLLLPPHLSSPPPPTFPQQQAAVSSAETPESIPTRWFATLTTDCDADIFSLFMAEHI